MIYARSGSTGFKCGRGFDSPRLHSWPGALPEPRVFSFVGGKRTPAYSRSEDARGGLSRRAVRSRRPARRPRSRRRPQAAAGGRHSPRLHSWPGALPEPRVFVSFGRGGACVRLAVRVRGRELGHHVASGPTRAVKRSGPFNPGASHDHDRTPRPRTGTPRPAPGFTTPGGGRAPRPGGVHSFSG